MLEFKGFFLLFQKSYKFLYIFIISYEFGVGIGVREKLDENVVNTNQ